MTGIVDWAAARARMVIAFIAISLIAGIGAYIGLPKEGEPDIEIPALFVSVPFPGISAEDSESLLVEVMETELSDLDGLDKMQSTAAENYAGVALEFEFGWDKTKIIADVRDRMNTAEGKFPDGFEKYSINEINFSQFPIIVVSLSGPVPERTLLHLAQDLQDRLEGLEPVLEAGLAGNRDEMLEVILDPLRLESYNVTASELINAVRNNNQLIAADAVETQSGAYSVKIPSSFDSPEDVFSVPIKVSGDRVVTLGDLADIRLTFEDREGTARFNGETTVALQVVKRKGFNIIDTAQLVRDEVAAEADTWPPELRDAIRINTSMDQSRTVGSMVSQLEGSVLTAVALVMIVVLASLGARSAFLVGFAIPTSFMLTFAFLALMGVAISNIVMFGLILAVGMLVDGAIVVVEYADRRINEGQGPMRAFVEAAKRMFWPIVSSTATTLCAFLPMLFWPGVAGEFMGMLPVTLIFVLSASLVVALVYLPVMGGVAGRLSRSLEGISNILTALPWLARVAIAIVAAMLVFTSAKQLLNPATLLDLPARGGGLGAYLPGGIMFILSAMLLSVALASVKPRQARAPIEAGYRRTMFGRMIHFIAGNPVMPLVSIAGVIGVVGFVMFVWFPANNNGVEFFVESEPEQAIVFVRARGNHSLDEKDALLAQAEALALADPSIQSVFAFAGEGGLNQNTGGAQPPIDTIGQIQLELVPWEDRPTIEAPWILGLSRQVVDPAADGDLVIERLQARLDQIPGIQTEILAQSQGPASAKPVHLRLTGDDLDRVADAARIVRAKMESTPGLKDVEDTLPLPGIDWEIDVDVAKAGRYGADVATVGAMVQLVTNGILLDTMRVPSSDEEIDIRVRLPEEDRVLSTLDTLKVRTPNGQVPLSNFITRTPVHKLGQIERYNGDRFYDVKAGIADGVTNAAGTPVTPADRIALLTDWLETENPLPAGIGWEWTGDQEDEAESQAFLSQAFLGALGLMFVILLAQFNSFYNAALVLTAVVLSTTGVLVGMIVMDQPFSVIMTGTGIVALAGIVVNNNIVLIDTYQEYSRYMPQLEAITRTAETRIRPVLLTTITTMAGLAPMMFGLSLDFFAGGYSIDSPTALWWKQLATAVVFGLGVSTVLTLVFTPSMLALRVWIVAGAYGSARRLAALAERQGQTARDLALEGALRKTHPADLVWEDGLPPAPMADDPLTDGVQPPLRAAE